MKKIRKKALLVTLGIIATTGVLFVTKPHFLEKSFESFRKDEDGDEVDDKDKDAGLEGEMISFWLPRGYPDFGDVQQKYLAAWDRAQELKREAENIKQDAGINGTSGTQTFNGSWTSIGPTGTFGGRILSIAVNPTRGNSVYIGSASGGIWKTYNAQGATPTWQPVTTGFPVLGVSSIVINPSDTNTIYVGTGEVLRIDSTGTTSNPGNTGFNVWKTRGTYGVGILKSTDGGTTWSQVLVKSENQLFGVQRIRIDPVTNTTVYAAATDGLYKSTNSGGTWTQILAKTYVSDVVINASNNQQIVVAVGNLDNTDKGVYKTTNGGTSWTKITAGGLPTPFRGYIKFDNLTSAGNQNTIVASIGVTESATGALCPGNCPNELYRSTDFGSTWTALSSSGHTNWQCWAAHAVAINPSNVNKLVYGGVGWTGSGNGVYNYTLPSTESSVASGVHADIHDIKFDPSNNLYVYVACDGGMYQSKDGGATFSVINAGLYAMQFYSTVGVSGSTNLVIGGLQDNGVNVYNGTTWNQIIGSDGAACAIDPASDQNVLASYDARAVYYSTTGTGGLTQKLSYWGEVHDSRTAFVAPLAISKSTPATVYVGTDELFKSTNHGNTWNATNPGTNYIDGLHKTAIALAISPTNASKVYVSTSPFAQYDADSDHLYYNPPSNVRRTTTGATPFTTINGTTNALPNRYIMHFAISPTDDDSVWVAVGGFGGGHVYVTPDGGVNWYNKDSGLPDVPANAIMLDPNNPQIIYVGNDMGVYVSKDNGTTWSDYNNGFWDATLVMDLEPYPGNKILAATHGKGAFISPLLSVSLPVTLTSFTGYNNNNGFAILNWSTSIEANLKSYSLERSTDGVNFSSVANIPAKNIDNSNYTYSDNISNIQNTTTVFYRLKIFNTDGTFVYSNVVPIALKPQPGIAIAGNPFSDQFTIIFTTLASAPAEARLMDASGRLLIRENFSLQAGTNSVSMQNLGSLAKGTYLLEFIVPGQRFTRKVVKK